jgi:hypothetical protein
VGNNRARSNSGQGGFGSHGAKFDREHFQGARVSERIEIR